MPEKRGRKPGTKLKQWITAKELVKGDTLLEIKEDEFSSTTMIQLVSKVKHNPGFGIVEVTITPNQLDYPNPMFIFDNQRVAVKPRADD